MWTSMVDDDEEATQTSDHHLLQQQQQQQQQQLLLSNEAFFMPWKVHQPVFVGDQYLNHHHHHQSFMASRYGLGVYDGGASSSSSRGFGLQPTAELMQKMTVQEIMDAKALAASKSHSEAERRRRERINTHLARLRSLLPSTTKTDKASLLAEVIQHVKELRRQTSMIAEDGRVPTESDELTVDAAQEDDGRTVIKASLCCDDRADLLPELIRALKSLRLKALRAEITTLGGRVRNVLVVAGEEAESDVAPPGQSVTSVVQEALRGVMERAVAAGEEVGGGGGGSKRQRTITNVGLLQQRSM